MQSRFFFKQIQHPINGLLASSLIFASPNRAQTDIFNKLNGTTNNEMLYPGRTLIAPSLAGTSESTHSGVANMCAQLAHAHRNARTAPAPKNFNDNFTSTLLSVVLDVASGVTDAAGHTLELREAFVGKRLDPILTLLHSIGERARQVHLGQMDARAGTLSLGGRQQLDSMKRMLAADVEKLPKWLSSMKQPPVLGADAAQISLPDTVRTLTTDGSPISTKQTADAIESVSQRISAVMHQKQEIALPLGKPAKLTTKIFGDPAKLGTKLEIAGAVLTVADAAVSGYQMFQTASAADKKFGSTAKEIVKVHQSSKIAGEVLGGYGVSLAAGYFAAPMVVPLLMAGPVGWVGLGVLGVAVAGAGYLAGMAGEAAGGKVGEKVLKSAVPGQDEFIDTVIDFSNNPVPLE